MKVNDYRFGVKEPPTLICDLCGNVIYANNKALNDLYPISVGDSVSKYVDIDYIKKLSILDNRLDVVVPLSGKYKRLAILTVGTGLSKTVELSFFNKENVREEDLLEEKRLFATFGEMIGNEIVGMVKLEEFVQLVIECMHGDLRFAYRRFEPCSGTVSSAMYANFSHLSTLAVAVIILLNEMEYRNPIKISVSEILKKHVLKISIPKYTFTSASGICEISELFPNVAMRMVYVASFCDKVGIKYDFSVESNEVSATFVITEMVNKTGKFSYSRFGSDEKAYISYVIDALASEIVAVEQEE